MVPLDRAISDWILVNRPNHWSPHIALNREPDPWWNHCRCEWSCRKERSDSSTIFRELTANINTSTSDGCIDRATLDGCPWPAHRSSSESNIVVSPSNPGCYRRSISIVRPYADSWPAVDGYNLREIELQLVKFIFPRQKCRLPIIQLPWRKLSQIGCPKSLVGAICVSIEAKPWVPQ